MLESVPPSPEPPVPETSPPSPSHPYRRRVPAFERMMFLVGIILGILVFTGFLSLHAMYLIPYPCTSATGCSAPSPEVATYDAVILTLAWISVGALDAAVGLSVGLAFILGSRGDLPETTRRSVFVFATVLVTAWTVLSFLFFPLLGGFLRYL